MSWNFAHRGRVGVDVAAVTITDLGADGIFGTSDDAVLRDLSPGNLIDAAEFGVGVLSTVPEPGSLALAGSAMVAAAALGRRRSRARWCTRGLGQSGRIPRPRISRLAPCGPRPSTPA